MLEHFADISQIITGFAAVGIAGLGYWLSRLQNSSSWLRNLNDLHQLYWQDQDFACVRAWLASDGLYPELEKSLKLRFSKPGDMTSEHYSRLERLDKFFNLLIRVKIVDNQYRKEDNLWDKLFFKFWIESIVGRERWYVLFYFRRFYLGTQIGRDLDFPETSAAAEAMRELALLHPMQPQERSM